MSEQKLSLKIATQKAELLKEHLRTTEQAVHDARAALRRDWYASRDEPHALAEHFKRRRGVDVREHDEKARELSLGLLERIRSEDLFLEPIDPARPAVGLRIVDPRPRRAYEKAQAIAEQAHREHDEFAEEYGKMLRDAQDKADIREVQVALKGSDPDALREALAGIGVGGREGPEPSSAWTTQ